MQGRLCELCGASPAEFIVCRVSGAGRRAERSLCAACAANHERVSCGNDRLLVTDLLAALINKHSASLSEQTRTKVCPFCGNTIERVVRAGVMGCAGCYSVFRDAVAQAVQEIHGPSAGRQESLIPADSNE